MQDPADESPSMDPIDEPTGMLDGLPSPRVLIAGGALAATAWGLTKKGSWKKRVDEAMQSGEHALTKLARLRRRLRK
jgi:hypothetical protein